MCLHGVRVRERERERERGGGRERSRGGGVKYQDTGKVLPIALSIRSGFSASLVPSLARETSFQL